jgi:hypothetical protein
MCPPKTPKLEKTPIRQAPKLPDNGDPTVASRNRQRQRLGPASVAALYSQSSPTVSKLGVGG